MKTLRHSLKSVQIKDIIIAMILIVLPFLSEIWIFVPKVDTLNIGKLTFDSMGFSDLSVLTWIVSYKLIIIIGLLIWYFTCKLWWRNAILVPLIIEFYKLFSVIDQKKAIGFPIDESEFIESLPITFPIFLIIIYLFYKLNYFSSAIRLNRELKMEIEGIFNSLKVDKGKKINQIEFELKKLKKNKGVHTKEKYYSLLIELRNKMLEL